MNKVNQETYARAFKLLMTRPVSSHEIAAETGLHIVTVYRLMRTFKQHGIVYVCNWRQDTQGRDAIPVYDMGFQKDKPRRSMTQAQRQRLCRERKEKKDAANAPRRKVRNRASATNVGITSTTIINTAR